ncbi:MAG: nucleotide exchange factor GrpE [Rickettsiales bacterium]|nr:nucleotide exchange factor GrpE [Rickettsiales bacterium]
MSEKFDNKKEKSQETSQKDSNKTDAKGNNELVVVKKKIKELEDQLLRSLADNENLRKRHEKEIQDSIKYSTKNFAYSLLSVVDNFQRAFNSIPKGLENDNVFKNLIIGINAVEKELQDTFEKNGVKMFNSLNEKFNPDIHQAISKIHNEKVPEGRIVEEMQKGFMIGDRLLRPAMVVVSMGPEKSKKTKEKV